MKVLDANELLKRFKRKVICPNKLVRWTSIHFEKKKKSCKFIVDFTIVYLFFLMLNICHTRDKRSQAEILNLGCSLVSLGRFEDRPMLSKYSAHCGVGIGMKFVPKVL